MSSVHMMDLHCLGWAQVGIPNLTIPRSCQARRGWERGPACADAPAQGCGCLTQLWAGWYIPGTVRGVLEHHVSLAMSRA